MSGEAWTPPPAVRSVRKRDGEIVPFDRERIVNAVRRAQEAACDSDPHFAREVADIVTLALGARRARGVGEGAAAPSDVEEIQDLVEQALVEMGRTPVAKAYILYRAQRSAAREALSLERRPTREGRMPLVRNGGGTAPWERGRIVAALVEEAELPRETAAEVARRVEGRVTGARLRRLSTTLIRELVAAELVAMGLESALQRQESVGVPRHDLRRMLAEAPRPALGSAPFEVASGDLSETAGGELLWRFVRADLLDERTADLCASGAIWIEDPRRPHLVLCRSLPAELCLRGGPHPHSGFEMLAELAPLLRGTARGMVIEGLHGVAAPMTRATRSTAGLRDVLAALGALSLAAGRTLDLAAPGGRGGSFVAHLLRALGGLAREGLATPRLWLAWSELAPAIEGDGALAELAEQLTSRGIVRPLWHARDERWVAPGCRRGPRERGALACGGAVAINLPRLARQAGPWREDVLHEALVSRVESALDALVALRDFQRDQPAAQVTAVRERVSYALVPVGFVEALRILADGELRAAPGARLLGVLADATRRLARKRGLTAVVSPLFGGRAAVRMAALDAGVRRPSQPRLFADLPAPETEADRPYSQGFAWPRLGGENPGEELAALLATVRSGALLPLEVASRSGPSQQGGSHPHLSVWRDFDQARSRSVGERSARIVSADTRPLFGS